MRVQPAPLLVSSITPSAIGAQQAFTVTATKTTTYTAASWELVPYDASGGAFQINLPGSPTVGDRVEFAEVGASANVLTIGRNGNDIENAASDITVGIAATFFGLVFISAAYGWKRY